MLKTCNEVIRSDLQEKKVNRDLANDKDFKVIRTKTVKTCKHGKYDEIQV